jgi:hypothetical protein
MDFEYDLLGEARTMALDLRLKDQIIASLQGENARLLARIAELEQPPGEE